MDRGKTSTDLHWNQRAESVSSDIEVNIMDVFQRELEYEYVTRYLGPAMRVLEVGCGNGFSTEVFRKSVAFVDAFDYSEAMIDRARTRCGEQNNRFFHDNILDLRHAGGPYDAVVCVRVLINLHNLSEQRLALKNMARMVAAGGRLILAEGFSDGFDSLNGLRASLQLPPIQPAQINFYSHIADLIPDVPDEFKLDATFHLGAYDYLTRVVYPMIVGAENAKHNTQFAEQCMKVARAHNPDCFERFSRMRGFVFERQ